MHAQQLNEINLVAAEIPGYTYGSEDSAQSPITLEEFALLKQTARFTSEDVLWLRAAGEAFIGHTREVVKMWRDEIATQPT